MHMLLVGINYKSAPVELRECFSIPEPQLEDALARLRESSAIMETVIVSTCNRTEVYAVVTDAAMARKAVYGLLEQVSNLPADAFRAHTYAETGQAVVRHLHRVVCGLDSMVIGETQILGQVRQAFLFAQATGTTGSLLNQLFRRAVTFGKRVTSIGGSQLPGAFIRPVDDQDLSDTLRRQMRESQFAHLACANHDYGFVAEAIKHFFRQ